MRVTFLFNSHKPWFSGQVLYFIEVMKRLKNQGYDVGYRVSNYLHPYAKKLLQSFNINNDSTDILVVTDTYKLKGSYLTKFKKLVVVIDNLYQKPIVGYDRISITHSPLIAKKLSVNFIKKAGFKVKVNKLNQVSLLTKHINDLSITQLTLYMIIKPLKKAQAYGDRVARILKHLNVTQLFSFHVSDILESKVFLHTNVDTTTIPLSVASAILSDTVVFSLSPYIAKLFKQKCLAHLYSVLEDDQIYKELLKQQKEAMSDYICTFDEYVEQFKEVVGLK